MEASVSQGEELIRVAAQAMLDGVNGWVEIIGKANRAIDDEEQLRPLKASAAQLGAALAFPARICATSPQTMPEIADRALGWGRMMERVMAGCWLIMIIESSEELAKTPLPTLDEVLSELPQVDIEAVSAKIDLSLLDQA